jgi:hypothetical protein
MEGLSLIVLAAGYWLNFQIIALLLALLLAGKNREHMGNTVPVSFGAKREHKARPSPGAADHAKRQNSIVQYGLFGVKPNEKKKAKRRG